ncbi:MAG: GNAT family N-acetyltransferase [Ruminococcus sp.]|nr:GNAT family N-acetyltransferase [Ruminococcus sp.]
MEKLNLIGAQPFETKRCRLRTFKLGDAEYVYKNYASSDNVTRYLSWESHQSLDDSREFCRRMAAEGRKPDSFIWVIELMETGEPIGSIGAVETDTEKRQAQLGFCLGEEWWDQGIMSECAEGVIAYLFFVAGFDTLTAWRHRDNVASGRVLEKCGMEKCGEDTVYLELKDREVPAVRYRLTGKDWAAKNLRF